MHTNNLDISLEGTLTGHQNPIFALSLGSDPNVLYTAGNDKGIVAWDLKEMRFQQLLCKVGASVYVLKMIPGTPYLAAGLRSGQLLVIDPAAQALHANLKTEAGAIFAIAFLPQKKEMIAIGEEGYAYVWSLENFELLYRFKVSDTTVRTIAVAPDEQHLALGDKNGFIHLFQASDYQESMKRQVHSLPVTSLLYSNGHLLSGGRDAQLFQLNPKNLGINKQITPHMFTVYGIDKSDYPGLIATASRDKSFKIWKEEDMSLLKNVSRDKGYDSHLLSINAMLWEADRIFTVSDDKTVKVWKLNSVAP